MTELTDAELNEKLARALGWTNCDVIKSAVVNGKKGVYRHSCRDPKGDPQLGIPDYASDLNACHEVEVGLSESQREEYAINLHYAATGYGGEFMPGSTAAFEFLNAKAKLRAEALLATLEAKEKL